MESYLSDPFRAGGGNMWKATERKDVTAESQMDAKAAEETWRSVTEGTGTDRDPFRVYLAGPDGQRVRYTEGLAAAIPFLNALQQLLADAGKVVETWQKIADERLQQLADWRTLCIEEQQRNIANKELFEQVEQQLADLKAALESKQTVMEAALRTSAKAEQKLQEMLSKWVHPTLFADLQADFADLKAELEEAKKYGEVRNKQWQDTQHNYYELQQRNRDLKAERDSLDEERLLLQRLFDDRHARWKATEAERDRYREALHYTLDETTSARIRGMIRAALISPSPIAPEEEG